MCNGMIRSDILSRFEIYSFSWQKSTKAVKKLETKVEESNNMEDGMRYLSSSVFKVIISVLKVLTRYSLVLIT